MYCIKIFELKELKPKTKGRTSFYEMLGFDEKSISNKVLLPFPQLVFLKYISLVFLFLLLEIDIEMTISESSSYSNFGNIRMHFLIAHLRELITDHREK